tara:strand:+ start:301 stop:669 length:369 start_codon:yes stop_codon:yes gene_type:complete
MSNILAIDFDGVIMRRQGSSIYGRSKRGQWRRAFVPPLSSAMPGAADAIKLLAQDWQLICHSCRGQSPQGIEGIEAWLDARNLLEHFDAVTARKPLASAYIDDRAYRFSTWADVLENFEVQP